VWFGGLDQQYYYSYALVKDYDVDFHENFASKIVLLRKMPISARTSPANSLKYVDTHSWDVDKSQYLRLFDSFGVQRFRMPRSKLLYRWEHYAIAFQTESG